MESFVCTKCGEEKPLTKKYFYVRKGSKTGFRYDCISCNLKNKKIYRDKPETKKLVLKQKRRYRKENKDSIKEWQKEYYQKTKETRREKSREWYQNNKDKVRKYSKKSYKKNYSNNLVYKISRLYRSRLWHFIDTEGRSKEYEELLGCTYEQLIEHIESQFEEGMTWDNWSSFGWHIDHKIPLSSAKNENEVNKLAHYTNLQPMWWRDNLSKGSKII